MIQLHTEIQIDAPPRIVWAIITAFEAYAQWNPFIPWASGIAATGERLTVQIAPPGLRKSRYKLTILDAEPEHRLRWIGHLLCPGLMDGDHQFTLEPNGNCGVRLVQSENFRGVLVPILSPWLKHNMRRGFEEMNVTLKKRSESMLLQESTSLQKRRIVA